MENQNAPLMKKKKITALKKIPKKQVTEIATQSLLFQIKLKIVNGDFVRGFLID